MKTTRLFLLMLFLVFPLFSHAAERMIAYGYANCVACHVNPQGRNLLTEYGNSVDESQSLRAGEYKREDTLILLDGKMNQILRGYLNQTVTRREKGTTTAQTYQYFNYQNATALMPKTTIAFGVDWRQPSEQASAVTSYYKAPRRDLFFLDYAFAKYVPSDGFGIVAGKDQLPTGINNGDASPFVHSRNALANNERPIQLKAFWWSQKYLISPYIYRENGDEAHDMGENGFGLLAESDVYNSRTVIGVNLLNGANDETSRQMASLYTRIGFIDRFGILAEFDQTWRKRNSVHANFTQQTVLGQIFYTPLEWVVWSVGYEYLNVTAPEAEFSSAYAAKLALRLSRNFTFTASLRHAEKDRLSTEVSQIALFAKY